MSENVTKKSNKKWVLKAMAIFVVVLLLLTFFSNTIMNATIPKVVGEYTTRGNLSYTNSATGTIVADNKASVKGIEGRTVAELKVGNYDTVYEGDTLLTLTPVDDQSQLESLRQQLTALQREAAYESRQPVEDDGMASMQQAINDAQLAVNEAQVTLDQANGKSATINAANAVISSNQAALVEYQAQVDSASGTLESLSAQISELNSQIDTINESITILTTLGTPTPTPSELPVDPGTIVPGSIDDYFYQIAQLRVQISQLESQMGDAQSRLDSASASLAAVQSTIQAAQDQIEEANALPSVAQAQSALNAANLQLQQARTAYTNAQISAGIQADQHQDAINDRNEQMASLESQIEELEAGINVVEIKAPADGYVLNISVSEGESMSATQVIMDIIPQEADCSVEFHFSTSVAQNMYVGMSLSTSEYWVESCVITSIKVDSENPRDSRVVKCHLEGSAWPGETITVVADRANANYDAVISSSAINEDNGGTFVYVIQQSSSALGDKYVVHRVTVSVEATDGARSAISGEGINGAQIVTRSEVPLNEGDRVRLQDYSSERGD